MFKHLNSNDVAAITFGQVAWTVTADLTLVVYAHCIGSVVSYYVVNTVSKELNASAFDKFAGFLMQNVWSSVTGHT